MKQFIYLLLYLLMIGAVAYVLWPFFDEVTGCHQGVCGMAGLMAVFILLVVGLRKVGGWIVEIVRVLKFINSLKSRR